MNSEHSKGGCSKMIWFIKTSFSIGFHCATWHSVTWHLRAAKDVGAGRLPIVRCIWSQVSGKPSSCLCSKNSEWSPELCTETACTFELTLASSGQFNALQDPRSLLRGRQLLRPVTRLCLFLWYTQFAFWLCLISIPPVPDLWLASWLCTLLIP